MTEQRKHGATRVATIAVLCLALGMALGVFLGRTRVEPTPSAPNAAPPAPAHAPARKVVYWYDPMKPEQHFDKPGRSPFMDMDLVPRYAEPEPEPTPAGERKVLYWYDPMKPEQHFDKPGRSPFMDMDLVPRYAEPESSSDAGPGTAGIALDASLPRTLGLRTVRAERGHLASRIEAVGEFQYNQRDVAKLQSRADGFVERVHNHAPGDVVARGAPLVDVLLPAWGSAQQEFLAVLDLGDPRLVDAARARLRLLGMPEDVLRGVERSRKPRAVITLGSPIGGVIVELEVRSGMRVAAGETLATINGSDPVWLEVAVPETRAAGLAVGAEVRAQLAAYAGEIFPGQVISILPAADSATRSVRVRASFANGDGRLRPGLGARVTIAEPPGTERVLVPSAALIRGGQQDRVMVVDDDDRYAPRIVTVGREADGSVEILDGLTAGERIAASVQFLLDADASLKGLAPAAPAMAPAHEGHEGHEDHTP